MKRMRWWRLVLALNLVGLIALAFVYPQWMISPGPLMPAHAELNSDCFACHRAGHGADPKRCMRCHALQDIGVRDTKGKPLPAAETATNATNIKTGFHRYLVESNCTACHRDHAGPRFARRNTTVFTHALLQTDVQQRCSACHVRPNDRLHATVTSECGQCHQSTRWTPAQFDHDRYFVLDADHQAPCATCHLNGDVTRYTCYGCHEHTPQKIRREHEEEGIRKFDNCVQCHRSAHGKPQRHGGDGERGGSERRDPRARREREHE